jgi:type II secretory pathway pseudopilin PulG
MYKIFNKQFNVPNGTAGFTIVETLVAIAILLLITLAVIGIMIGYNRYFEYLKVKVDVPQSAGSVINLIANDVREADQVLLSRSFSGTLYTTGANSLILGLHSVDNSGNILVGKHDYIVFYLNGTQIYSLTESDPSSVRPSISKKISDTTQSLTFIYDNVDITLVKKVDISIQNSKQIRDQIIQSNLHQQVYFRNK